MANNPAPGNSEEKKPGGRSETGKKKTARFGSVVFLGIVVIAYLFIWVLNPALFSSSYSTFLGMSSKIAPIFAFVIVIILFLNVVISDRLVAEHLGRQAGFRGWVIVIVAGIIASGPQYLWFQLLQDLKEKGMRTGYMAAFLYAKAVKLFILPMMVYYFGWDFTLVLTAYMVAFSFVNGRLVEALVHD